MNSKTTVISQEQLQQQLAFCGRIYAYWQERDRTPLAYVETYVCSSRAAMPSPTPPRVRMWW